MATPATDFLAAAARALVEGEPGAEVVRTLQTRHTTLHSLQKALSNVRAILVDGGHRPPEYDTAPLRAAMPDAAEVRAFLDAPLREQLKIQRAHRANPTWRLQQTTAAVEHQAEQTTTIAAEGEALAGPLAAYEVGGDDDCDAIPLVRSIWHSKSGYKSVTFNSNHRAAKKPWQAKDD